MVKFPERKETENHSGIPAHVVVGNREWNACRDACDKWRREKADPYTLRKIIHDVLIDDGINCCDRADIISGKLSKYWMEDDDEQVAGKKKRGSFHGNTNH